MSNPGRLAPQARPQALAELDARIAEAQRARDYQHGILSRIVAARQDPKPARLRLKLADDRLAQFQRSREVLIGGEDHSEAEAS